METIPKSQKKIIVISFSGVLVFLILWFFIYLPSKNSISKIKSEVFTLEGGVKRVEKIMDKSRTIEEAIKTLEERGQELKNKFFQKEEESLRMLSVFAKGLNIELISLKPLAKQVFLDADNREIKIEGRACQVIPVSLEMRCFYKYLIKYLDTLNKKLPAFITIERLNINREKPGVSRLNILLELNLYLLS